MLRELCGLRLFDLPYVGLRLFARAEALRYDFGQLRDGRRLEQAAQSHLGLKRRAQAGDQLDRQQRMAAEFEELVVNADPLDAEEFGPYLSDLRLDLVP